MVHDMFKHCQIFLFFFFLWRCVKNAKECNYIIHSYLNDINQLLKKPNLGLDHISLVRKSNKRVIQAFLSLLDLVSSKNHKTWFVKTESDYPRGTRDSLYQSACLVKPIKEDFNAVFFQIFQTT